MFTGIIEERGVVRRAEKVDGVLRLELAAPGVARQLDRGDSVAVNGVCLTATRVRRRYFRADLMDETLERTTLGRLTRGDEVNLELPVRLIDRLGGHLVQGHVDGVGNVVRAEDSDGTRRAWVEVPRPVLAYMVPQGSVALDGVSLTVVDVEDSTFEIALIPHTLAVTTLAAISEGMKVNVEVDVIAKYVAQLIERK